MFQPAYVGRFTSNDNEGAAFDGASDSDEPFHTPLNIPQWDRNVAFPFGYRLPPSNFTLGYGYGSSEPKRALMRARFDTDEAAPVVEGWERNAGSTPRTYVPPSRARHEHCPSELPFTEAYPLEQLGTFSQFGYSHARGRAVGEVTSSGVPAHELAVPFLNSNPSPLNQYPGSSSEVGESAWDGYSPSYISVAQPHQASDYGSRIGTYSIADTPVNGMNGFADYPWRLISLSPPETTSDYAADIVTLTEMDQPQAVDQAAAADTGLLSSRHLDEQPVQLDNGKYGCPTRSCQRQYKNKRDCSRHFQDKHAGRPRLQCDYCFKSFLPTRTDQLKKHVEELHPGLSH
ncbi:hypothetical protein PUNSTDRAFT_139156 [Punctularia strigosozonata HHB-11173 SS5]|uniref:C2H2-type domain-containing protein n=1 Tax=Punctularia strigosozonata (strain HHB-11173) TaxID=741275 RepID=R7S3P8_PUNST|nr:uncharacterized protein PUNSTDRAFT_139156 [Punctularia strigosozonata HHB-11173 SS5]EIN03851.1 hypothetical protein PUNSTDRAFT_139156 [Punctularia strigosozonata HHB-11173 SS5]